MTYTLDQVRCFVAVAEEWHFGRAAERLNMTQPPLSRQIQKLERSLGFPLLDRTNRSVRLTAAGDAFLPQARKMLLLSEEASAAARRAAEGTAGYLRLGFTASSSFSALDAFLEVAGTLVPDLQVEMYETVTRDQIQQLRDEQLDIALGRPSNIPDDIATLRIIDEEFVLAVPAGHRLTQQSGPIDPHTLGDQRFIIQSRATARYFFDLVTKMAPVEERNIAHQSSQILTILALVRAGRGVALIPASTQHIQLSGVSYLPVQQDPISRIELHALWSPSNDNPVVRKILTHLHSTPGAIAQAAR